MIAGWLADLVVLVHVAFVAFVVAGGLLVLRRPRLAWLHLPAAAWGFVVEATGWICPLTPLENRLRAAGGAAGYRGGFVEHYLLRALYPDGLTRGIQWGIAALVVVVNVAIYSRVVRRARSRTSRKPEVLPG